MRLIRAECNLHSAYFCVSDMSKHVSYDEWKIFLVVSDFESYQKAARVLKIDPATLSKRIKRLEEFLGVQLFYRDNQGVYPTVAGRSLLKRVRPIFERLEVLRSELQRTNPQLYGQLSIAIEKELYTAQFVEYLDNFEKLYPSVHLSYVIHNKNRRLASSCDLRLYYDQITPSVSWRTIPVPVACVASPLYVQTYGIPQTPEMLLDHKLLGQNDITIKQMSFIQKEQRYSIPLVFGQYFNGSTELIQACCMGKGIAVGVARYLLQNKLRNKELIRILPQWSLNPILVCVKVNDRWKENALTIVLSEYIQQFFTYNRE